MVTGLSSATPNHFNNLLPIETCSKILSHGATLSWQILSIRLAFQGFGKTDLCREFY